MVVSKDGESARSFIRQCRHVPGRKESTLVLERTAGCISAPVLPLHHSPRRNPFSLKPLKSFCPPFAREISSGRISGFGLSAVPPTIRRISQSDSTDPILP